MPTPPARSRPRDHRDGNHEHQDLRRHHQRRGRSDGHGRHAGGGDSGSFTETYDTKNVGTGKTLTATGTVNDGNGGNNYAVTFVADTTGAITARAITVTATTNTKIYDGTTSAAAMPTVTGGTLAAGDTGNFTETYDTKNVGTGKTLTATGSVNDGNGGNNYAVTFIADTTGAITARAITVTATTQYQDLRRHHQRHGHSDASQAARWRPVTPAASRKPMTPKTSAPARR